MAKLLAVLEEHSASLLSQWEVTDDGPPSSDKTCVCSKPVGKPYYIRNKITSKVLVVGPCCVKTFTHKECTVCGKHHKQKSDKCRPCRLHSESVEQYNQKKILMTGPYKDHSYLFVFVNDREYCEKARRIKHHTDPNMLHFSQWLQRKM